MNILNILFKNRRLRKPLILLVSTLFAVLFSELLVYFQVYFFWSSELSVLKFEVKLKRIFSPLKSSFYKQEFHLKTYEQ